MNSGGPSGRPHLDNWAVGRRLVRLREVLGYKGHGSQGLFAETLGYKKVAWNQYETGTRELPPAIAVRLFNEYGVPVEWLYIGDVRNLPPRLKALRDHKEGRDGTT